MPNSADLNLAAVFTSVGGIKWAAFGLLFGLLVAVSYFYLLELTLKWAFTFTPRWGKFLVIVLYYLRFGLLAGVLYLVFRLAGFPLALGTILGVLVWQLVMLIRNIKTSISDKQFPKDTKE